MAEQVVAQLKKLGVELVNMDDDKSMGGAIGGMFWRFLVAGDPAIDRFIVRDSDSRLNPRERLAVEVRFNIATSGATRVIHTSILRFDVQPKCHVAGVDLLGRAAPLTSRPPES